MRVRPATADDAPAVAGVQIRSYQRAYAHILPACYLAALDLKARTANWHRSITERGRPGRIFVTGAGNDVTAFISLGLYRPGDGADPDPAIGEVSALYADPAHWSTGAGRALMDAAVAHLTAAGCTEIRLWVFDDNPRARRFYERAGFRPDGERSTYTVDADGPYSAEADEVRYTLAVP
jgi:ribosomal protein S18 acetylase RimI-like enzyme